MRVITQMDSSPFEAHGRGIRIGGANPKISGSPVEAMDFPLLPTFFRDPVVSSSIVCRKFFKIGLGDDGGEKHGLLFGKWCVTAVFFGTLRLYRFWRKKGGEMLSDCLSCLDGKTRSERIQIGIGIDLCRVEIQLLAPHQLRLLTLLDNGIEELPKHLQAVPQADLAETGMIGQRLIQIVPEIPSDAQSIRDLTHEQAFRADIFKKHH